MINEGALTVPRKWRGSALTEAVGSLLGFAFVLLTIWGIGWSFYRHGPGDGILAFFAPPYAWYRGVASIWETPKWKDDYDVRTEQLALVVENSVNVDPAYQIQSRDFIRDLHNWLKMVPRTQRDSLREAARNYAAAISIYCQRYLSAMITGGDNLRVDLDPAVQQHSDRFKGIKGFVRQWDRFVQESSALKDLSIIGGSDDSQVRNGQSLTVGEKAIMQNRLRTQLDTLNAKMENTIDDLFTQDR